MDWQEKASRMTDAECAAVEARIKAEYLRATKELEKRLNNYVMQSEEIIKETRKKYRDGLITRRECNGIIQERLIGNRHWEAMRNKISMEYANIASKTDGWIRQSMDDVFVYNYNAMLNFYDDVTGLGLHESYVLYNKDAIKRIIIDNPKMLPYPSVDIPAAVRWNNQKIQSEIIQAILQGDSIPNVAKRLRIVSDMNLTQSLRNARTAMNAAQNGARELSGASVKKELNNYGYTIMKKWQSATDARTRKEHLDANGQTVEIEQPFNVGDEQLLYPCDFEHGSGWNLYNCRCRRTDVLVKLEDRP